MITGLLIKIKRILIKDLKILGIMILNILNKEEVIRIKMRIDEEVTITTINMVGISSISSNLMITIDPITIWSREKDLYHRIIKTTIINIFLMLKKDLTLKDKELLQIIMRQVSYLH